jgi:hypothetical protein
VGVPVWQRIGLGVLAEHIPAGLVDQVLADTGRVQRRVRRLPARAVVWFVLALTLFHGQGYRSVWRELAHDGDDAPTPSASGLSQARRRLGVAPLAALFARLRGTQALPGAPGAFLSGLRLVSWDATMLDVPDSDANAAVFIASRNRKGSGAFPKARLMTLIEVGTHAVIDAVFGAVSEQALARRVLGSLGTGMLLLGGISPPTACGATPPQPAPTCCGGSRPACPCRGSPPSATGPGWRYYPARAPAAPWASGSASSTTESPSPPPTPTVSPRPAPSCSG